MAASRAGPAPHEDGMDILKFFIAIMGFLTLVVAVMAIVNWSKVNDLKSQIEEDETNLEEVRKIAASKEMRDLIARERASKDLVDVLTKDLGKHLTETATKMNLKFLTYEQLGAVGFKQQGFDKMSFKFSFDHIRLEHLTEFLFYLQLSWPGLKIEEISVQEAQRKKPDDPFADWRTVVTVSIFRPKA